MLEAFYVTASSCSDSDNPCALTYLAMSETPEGAVELVRKLVADGTKLTATGRSISMLAAQAIGMRPGRAKLV